MAEHGSGYPAELWSLNLFRFPDLAGPAQTLKEVVDQNSSELNFKIKPATIGILAVYNESFQLGKIYQSKPFYQGFN